ncbi:MAG: ATP-binding protein [Phycisphaerales bacterium]|nr:ATP-binding protein [Phycisphaerales bacterium]MCB9862301.1 ATP-binding protein [Phycisphaerales bacterium]
MDKNQLALRAKCGLIFSPGAPINRYELFAGRVESIRKVVNAVTSRGRHVIMYGQRGVGKTSLASIFKDIFHEMEGLRIFKINCAETDGFHDVWRNAFREIPVIVEGGLDDLKQLGKSSIEYRLDQLFHDEAITPSDIRRIVQTICQDDFEVVLIFDEFDRLAEEERALFADTIKDLSDNSVNTTVVLVGVARDVIELLQEHESIKRCVVQVSLEPMDWNELKSILTKAMAQLYLTMDDAAIDLIVFLSQGYPFYTHLLGQEATYCAIDDNRKEVTLKDVGNGIKSALGSMPETESAEYHAATISQRENSLNSAVLLACALAKVDQRGYFSSADLRAPMKVITGKSYQIPQYAKHLKSFSEDESRGPVLHKTGATRRIRYGFANPLLRPYVILKGIAEKMIGGDLTEWITVVKPETGKGQLPLFT